MTSKPQESVVPPETAEVPSPETEPADNQELGTAELEQLLDQYSETAITSGEIRPATVVNLTADGVVVDLGLKSEGLVPLTEFSDEKGEPTIQPGAQIEVLIEGHEPKEGYVPCSSEGAHRLKLLREVESAYREQRKLTGRVTGRVKGGLQVEINLPGAHPGRRPLDAFMPGSQVDIRPVRHWEGFLNRELPCRILKFNRRRGNLVVSRRLLLEEEQKQRKKLLEEVLKEGAVLPGTVKNITDYGAFVDLGGIDGLLHITDISHRRLTHPAEALKSGQAVQVKVLKVDKEKERISLGMKQLEPDPWQAVPKKYAVGERVRGRVTHLVDFGAFVELEPGVEGMIHVSEMSWTKRVKRPSDVLSEGDLVEAAVRGRVVRKANFGAFVELAPGVEGLCHASEIPAEDGAGVEVGQEHDFKIIKVNPGERRIGLSLKAMTSENERRAVEQYRNNQPRSAATLGEILISKGQQPGGPEKS